MPARGDSEWQPDEALIPGLNTRGFRRATSIRGLDTSGLVTVRAGRALPSSTAQPADGAGQSGTLAHAGVEEFTLFRFRPNG